MYRKKKKKTYNDAVFAKYASLVLRKNKNLLSDSRGTFISQRKKKTRYFCLSHPKQLNHSHYQRPGFPPRAVGGAALPLPAAKTSGHRRDSLVLPTLAGAASSLGSQQAWPRSCLADGRTRSRTIHLAAVPGPGPGPGQARSIGRSHRNPALPPGGKRRRRAGPERLWESRGRAGVLGAGGPGSGARERSGPSGERGSKRSLETTGARARSGVRSEGLCGDPRTRTLALTRTTLGGRSARP